MINSASDYRTTRGGAEDYVVSGQAMDTRESMMQQVYQTGFMTLPNSRKNLVREVLKSGKPGQAPGNLTATMSQPEAVRLNPALISYSSP